MGGGLPPSRRPLNSPLGKEFAMATLVETGHQKDAVPFFTFFVNDREFRVHQSTITAGEIMDLAGLPRDVGLMLINEDGTQESLSPDHVLELRPGHRFKKAPRLKRGDP
jgi:hypothetical protein